MPCPLFIPSAPLGDLVTAPLPLGDLYDGVCAACASERIDGETLRTQCNIGYARGACAHAEQTDSDAIRFLVKSDREGIIEIAWSKERDHHPVAVGVTIISRTATQIENGDILTRQAAACAASYLKYTKNTQG